MQKTRVLVVDDSVVVRKMLTEVLSAEADIEVAGTASTAGLALAKLEQSTPDVVTLDVELPDLSGLELLERIRVRSPHLPIIMFSSLTQRAAVTTLEALARGASDYVGKPSQTGSREQTVAQIRRELVPKIRAFGRRFEPISTRDVRSVAAVPRAPLRIPSGGPIEVLAIGCSTGGPNALAEIFRQLPAHLPVPVVVVQHMPPLFTRLLAERLHAAGPLRFSEAVDGKELEPGHVYIAPGDHHLRVAGIRPRLVIGQEAPENSCRPAVDPLFRSVAAVYGRRALAVVLTGMGQDGLRGAEAIREAGGQIVVQDEASSVVWGMPGFVARAGLADAVVPLGSVAGEILRRIADGGPRSERGRSCDAR